MSSSARSWSSGRGLLIGDRCPRLAASALALAHFCDASNERTLDPLEFVTSLSNGLAQVVPGFADAVAEAAAGASTTFSITGTLTAETVHPGASAAGVKFHLPRDIPTRQAFAQLVRKPLEAIHGFDGQVLVLVDDLSGGYRYDSDDNISRLIGTVADDPAELPECLRFVVTSRPETWSTNRRAGTTSASTSGFGSPATPRRRSRLGPTTSPECPTATSSTSGTCSTIS